MIRRLLAALGLAAALGLLFAPAAGALNLPGSDCLNPPTPTAPAGGVAGWIDPGPTHPVTGDPWSGKPGAPTIYDVYGYGAEIVAYDPPTIGPTCVSLDPSVTVTNWVMGASDVLVALSVRLYRTILSPDFGGIFDPIQHAAQNVIGRGLFLPLVGVTVLAAGAFFVWRASRDNVGKTASRTGKLLAIVIAGVACTVFPITIGAAVDKALGETVSTGAGLAVHNDPRHEPADALAGAVQSSVNYNSWAQATFGPGAQGEAAAKEFGPRLYEAAHWTRTEESQMAADPAKAGPWTDAKQQRYKDTAKAVQDKFPAVYEHLRGAQTDTAFGFAFVGLVGAVLAVGFLIYALFKIGYAMVLLRVGIGAAPAVALVAAFPTQQHRASALFETLWKALATAVVLGAAALVFTVAGVGGILSPSTQLPPAMKLLAMGLLSYALYRGAKQFGVISEKQRQKQEQRDLRDERRDEPRDGSRPDPVMEPVYEFTAESRMRTRTAPRPAMRAARAVAAAPSGPAAVAAAASRPALHAAPGHVPTLPMAPHPLPPAQKALPASRGVYTIHSLGAK